MPVRRQLNARFQPVLSFDPSLWNGKKFPDADYSHSLIRCEWMTALEEAASPPEWLLCQRILPDRKLSFWPIPSASSLAYADRNNLLPSADLMPL